MNQGHVKSGEIINLGTLKKDMEVDASYAIVKTPDMEVIRMALPRGKSIEKHRVDGEISIQCLKGHAQFWIGDITRNVTEGDWLYLKRQQLYSYSAKEDTILLITILFATNATV